MSEARLTGQFRDGVALRRWLDEGGGEGVTSLSLWDGGLDDDDARALAEHPSLAALRSLDLSWNLLGPDGAAALARGLPALTSLRLYHNDLGEAGAAIIADGAWSLRSLNLCGNGIGPGGAARLAGAPRLRGLRSLHLGHVGLGDGGVRALIASEWPVLDELNVRDNAITGAGAALLTSGALPALCRLGLDDNPIDDEGLRALARGPGWATLTWLNLGGTDLGPAAALALVDADRSLLTELRVQGTAADLADLAARLPGCAILG